MRKIYEFIETPKCDVTVDCARSSPKLGRQMGIYFQATVETNF